MTQARFELTVGPVLFNWPAARLADFYARIADEAPVDRVVIGESVCSKREPFHADVTEAAIGRLERAGKKVVLASLTLVTLERERRAARAMVAPPGDEAGSREVDIDDLTLLGFVPPGGRFSIGPMVNVYGEATLGFLARHGARRICLPPELPFASVAILGRAAAEQGVGLELFAYGRMPLAISGRCYHARVHGLSKDSCQFVCEQDPDGLPVRTSDGTDFLAVNGVQTLSYKFANLVGDLDRLAGVGVTSLRLSPHTGDFIAVTHAFAAAAAGALSAQEALRRVREAQPQAEFTDGFLFGGYGAAPLSVA
ncbi:MAG: U32 family peptidase [Rhodospirillales bacterium]|nr:U32 family peptidase [Rhodospirillales bacterium]